MEKIIQSVRDLFTSYGFHAATVVLVTIAVVNIIKKPIVKKAEDFAEKTGIDKSIITKNVTIIPVAVAFLIELITALIAARFDFRAVDYGSVTSASVLYGALAIATYESVKKQLRAYAASTYGNVTSDDKTENNAEKETETAALGTKENVEAVVPATEAEDNDTEQPVFSANGE